MKQIGQKRGKGQLMNGVFQHWKLKSLEEEVEGLTKQNQESKARLIITNMQMEDMMMFMHGGECKLHVCVDPVVYNVPRSSCADDGSALTSSRLLPKPVQRSMPGAR